MLNDEKLKKYANYPKKVFEDKLDRVVLRQFRSTNYDNREVRIYVDMPSTELKNYKSQVEKYYEEKTKNKKFTISVRLISRERYAIRRIFRIPLIGAKIIYQKYPDKSERMYA